MIADIIPKLAVELAKMEREDSRPFWPRPSSAGPERCIRSMVYHALGYAQKPLAGRALLIFSDSSFHEDLTNDWLRQSPFQLHSEQMHINIKVPFDLPAKKCSMPGCEETTPENHIGGHDDGMLTDLMKKDYLYEHKAINHFTFQGYWNGEYPLDNLTQTAMYIKGAREWNPELTDGVLLIKNKNTAQYMEFLVTYDPVADTLRVISKSHSDGSHEACDFFMENVVQGALDKFAAVLDHRDKKTLPKRPYFLGDDWQCDYCAWGETCWKGYEKEFLELKTDELLPKEFETMVIYYKELGGQKRDIDKEYKDLSAKIKTSMKEAGARQGRAGEYVLNLKLQNTSSIDKKLIPAVILEKATNHGQSERLYISKPKPKAAKKKAAKKKTNKLQAAADELEKGGK